MGGLIFGIVRVLVNWWAYTWGGLIFGWAYIRRFTVVNFNLIIRNFFPKQKSNIVITHALMFPYNILI